MRVARPVVHELANYNMAVFVLGDEVAELNSAFRFIDERLCVLALESEAPKNFDFLHVCHDDYSFNEMPPLRGARLVWYNRHMNLNIRLSPSEYAALCQLADDFGYFRNGKIADVGNFIAAIANGYISVEKPDNAQQGDDLSHG